MKKYIVLYMAMLVCSIAFAQNDGAPRRPSRIPAVPNPVEWIQPSGDTIIIRLVGDEKWNCRMTEDGFVLAENKKGALCYAKVDRKGNFRPTRIVAHKPEQRTKKELKYIEKMKKNEKLWRKQS